LKDRAPGDRSPNVLVCSSCGYLFFQNSKPCVGAIILRRGRGGPEILLARRGIPPHLGMWDIPGGFLANGETPEDGLQRELEEELGVRAEGLRLVSIQGSEYPRDDIAEEARHTLTLYYLCAIPPEATLTPADDVTEAQWFPLHGLPAGLAFEANRRALRDAIKVVEAAPL
jgi:ADP-ribose pyrophosphatase YjhB (NUDIX family)